MSVAADAGWEHSPFSRERSSAGYYNYTLNENGRAVTYGSGDINYSTDVISRDATAFIQKQTKPFFLMVT